MVRNLDLAVQERQDVDAMEDAEDSGDKKSNHKWQQKDIASAIGKVHIVKLELYLPRILLKHVQVNTSRT